MDKRKDVTAAAHKLARLIYIILTTGEDYTEQGKSYCEERYRELVVRGLSKKIAELGIQITPAASPG